MAGYFAVTTNKGTCAISGKPLRVGLNAFFLVLRGNRLAGPEAQILTSSKDDGFSTGFRSVVVGKTYPRFGRAKNVYGVEEKTARGWVRVETWSQVVLLDEALAKGFKNPGPSKTNFRGGRTVGVEHTTAEPEVETIEPTSTVAPVAPIASAPEVTKDEPVTIVDVVKAFAGWNVD